MFKNNAAFTLVEMLIVLMIISVLIILIVPTMSNSKDTINEKGCDALISVVQNQTDLYYLEENKYPEDINALKEEEYITELQMACSNGRKLEIKDGTVMFKATVDN